MTPQQKADKLCMRFLIQTTTDVPYGINKAIAKECALIAVDELLEATKRYDYTLGPNPSYNDYWLKVKYQIENL
jgi:hypothetical protein